MGANAFYDYELDSKHKRTGFGVELLTSLLEMRANKYNAVSGTITHDGINETALDGHDIKITGNLPYFYSSNIYFKQSEFKDGAGYKTENDEWGFEAEMRPTSLSALHSRRTATIPRTLLPLSDTASLLVQTQRQPRRSKTASGPQA